MDLNGRTCSNWYWRHTRLSRVRRWTQRPITNPPCFQIRFTREILKHLHDVCCVDFGKIRRAWAILVPFDTLRLRQILQPFWMIFSNLLQKNLLQKLTSFTENHQWFGWWFGTKYIFCRWQAHIWTCGGQITIVLQFLLYYNTGPQWVKKYISKIQLDKNDVTGLVVSYGIHNTTVLEMPWLDTGTAIIIMGTYSNIGGCSCVHAWVCMYMWVASCCVFRHPVW